MGTYIKWIIMIISLLFFITFGIKNSQLVSLHYYFSIEGVELPLYGLVFIAILLGIAAGMLIGIADRWGLGKKVKDLKRENRDLSEKLKIAEEERLQKESETPKEQETLSPETPA
jgi:uncharacterized integral membrane protein